MAEISNLIVAIGASAGGLKEILTIVSVMPESFAGSLIVATHRPPESGRNLLADLLKNQARAQVSRPYDNDKISCSTIYVGAANERVEVGDQGRFDIDEDASKYARIRRIDDLFSSVAESAGKNSVGVVLSGMLWDGVEGLQAISAVGGHCIVQDPIDASYESMPVRALDKVDADFIGTSEEIARHIVAIAEARSCHD